MTDLPYNAGEDTPTKTCTLCNGKGKEKISTEHLSLTIPAFDLCVRCGGSGIMDMDHEEIMFNHELELDRYAEQED